MFPRAKVNAGFIGKHITSLIGSVLLSIFGTPPLKTSDEKRLLVVFGGGIGDVVIASVACGYIKNYLERWNVSYLMPYKFELPGAEEHIFYNYRKAKENPFYYFELVNGLRKKGFSDVIVLFPFWEGFLSSLAADIGSPAVFFYKEYEMNAFHRAVSRVNAALRSTSLAGRARYIPVVSGWTKGWAEAHRDPALPLRTFPSIVGKNAYYISQAIVAMRPELGLDKQGFLPLGDPQMELQTAPTLEAEFLANIWDKYHVKPEECCLIGLGTSDPFKNWQINKFVAVAKAIRAKGLKIAIIDHPKDAALVEQFAREFGNDFINLGPDADLPRLFILIKRGAMVLANDTSFIHLAIAFGTPSVCVVTNDGMGAYSLYGRERINRWVMNEDPGNPWLATLPAAPVIAACEDLIDGIKSSAAAGPTTPEPFLFHFGSAYDYKN